MRRDVSLTDEAMDDLRALQERDPALVTGAIAVIKRVATGQLDPRPLRSFSKTGDLSDCSKAYFGFEDGDDTYRIVFREVGGRIDVLEVVVIEARGNDLAYLLAGIRFGAHRRSSSARRRQANRTPDHQAPGMASLSVGRLPWCPTTALRGRVRDGAVGTGVGTVGLSMVGLHSSS